MPVRTDETRPLRIAIAGAGLAGACAYLTLSKLPNVEIRIYERSVVHRQTGAWIGVTESGIRILDDFVGEGVLASVSTMRNTTPTMKAPNGTIIAAPTTEGAYLGAQTVRQDLHRIMIDAIPAEHVVGGKRVMGYERLPDGVRLKFADYTSIDADLLIAADGINSRLRKALRPGEELVFSGTVEYMEVFDKAALVEKVPNLPDGFTFWHGGEEMVFMGDVGLGRYSIICVIPEDKETGGRLTWSQLGGAERIEKLQTFFGNGWDPVISAVIGQMRNMSLYPVYRGTFLEHVTDGDRTVFIGDAAHPTGGAYGAGCSFAFGDAEALSLALKQVHKEGDLSSPATLRRGRGRIVHIYDEARRDFCRRVFEQLGRELETGEFEDHCWLAVHDVRDEMPRAIKFAESLKLDYTKPLILPEMDPELEARMAEAFRSKRVHSGPGM